MKLRIPYLVVSVGQMCNLKCKNCSNFVPYAPKELLRYPIENIITDFEALFKTISRIDLLQIQGGEPFTYTDLPKLTSYLSACNEIGEIVVATNGTITPQDEVWHNLSINNIKLRVSNYLQNRSNLKKFLNKAQTYRVNVNLYNFASRENLWYDCGGLDTPREDNDEIVFQRFNSCAFKGCLTIENGTLHRCSRAPNAHIMQNFEQSPPLQILLKFETIQTYLKTCIFIYPIHALKLLVAIVTAR